MTCQEFRAAVGADPRASSAEIESHAARCADCRAWRLELQRMDEVIRRALAIDVDASAIRLARADSQRAAHRWRGWAMAAGIMCAILVASLMWIATPHAALADDVVAHMSEEPNAWARTDIAADPAKVASVLARSGVKLKEGAGLATYANSCWFRGHYVPHLVFQTGGGPVTVMVLTEEHVADPVEFDEQGYSGVLVPARRGALAILGRGSPPGRDFMARVRAAIGYTGT